MPLGRRNPHTIQEGNDRFKDQDFCSEPITILDRTTSFIGTFVSRNLSINHPPPLNDLNLSINYLTINLDEISGILNLDSSSVCYANSIPDLNEFDTEVYRFLWLEKGSMSTLGPDMTNLSGSNLLRRIPMPNSSDWNTTGWLKHAVGCRPQ
ncbi:hypothetical protein K435DRAFT_795052 [Dendrothele bispora CBS 962.96]|uniref:Uncharacterized protein n=1 Tax=Dendrothele bispora (strain CBS 962.96) TaxID=1314807 RepID=A0A4S8MBA8_DENBC|nr:hypothetical protein K435DRAFT_795052 [Dendrothele bispora CBS 962.96]